MMGNDTDGVQTLEDTNVTPKGPSKKLTQQVFHPSLFNRGKPTVETETLSIPTEPSSQASKQPPEWQIVPESSRKHKRKRVATNSPTRITSDNRFSALPVDVIENNKVPKKQNKPPPVHLIWCHRCKQTHRSYRNCIGEGRIFSQNYYQIPTED